MYYLDLIPEVRMIYALISVITFIISITDCIRILSSFNEKSPVVVPAFSAAVNAVLYNSFTYGIDVRAGFPPAIPWAPLFECFIRMPAAAYGMLVLGTLVISSISYVVTSNKINSKITLRSIRDGFNTIDTGVLMYKNGGFILLANTIMQHISQDITGKRVTNGEIFKEIIFTPDNHIVLSDGTVYLIKENILNINSEQINELTAVNVTTQTNLRKEVKLLEDRKEAFNKRLSDYSQKVDEVTIKKEILDTKIDVHEALGNILLLTKSYLKGEKNAPDKESLKSMWHKAIMFKEAISEKKEDQLAKSLYDAAYVCGIKLRIEGELPPKESTQIRKILSTASREAIINASRHALADRMTLKITYADGLVSFAFTNNGKAAGKITEGGGLSSLRQLVNSNGGTMEIITSPRFSIIITVPEKVS